MKIKFVVILLSIVFIVSLLNANILTRREGIFIKLHTGQCQFAEKNIQNLYIKEKYKDDIFYGGQIGYHTKENFAGAFGLDYIKVQKDSLQFTVIPVTFNFSWYMDILGKDILDPYLMGGIALYRYYGDIQLEGESEHNYSDGYTFGAQGYVGLKFKYFLFIEGGYSAAGAIKNGGKTYSLGTARLRGGIQIQF